MAMGVRLIRDEYYPAVMKFSSRGKNKTSDITVLQDTVSYILYFPVSRYIASRKPGRFSAGCGGIRQSLYPYRGLGPGEGAMIPLTGFVIWAIWRARMLFLFDSIYP